jgi:glutathione S-transferase
VILYDYLDSGNGYKIRLLLAQLARPYRWVELDIMTGAQPEIRMSRAPRRRTGLSSGPGRR